MQKHLIAKLLSCLLLFISIDLQGDDKVNIHLEWQKQHSSELQEGIKNYLESKPLILLKAGSVALYLDENPKQMHMLDVNHYLIAIAGEFAQEEARLFALFFVHEQIEPYQAMPLLLYTCNDRHHMPSVELYFDVKRHPFVIENYLSNDFRVHINTVIEEENGYVQDWVLYNEEEYKTIRIVFSSDGSGGTHFSFML